MTNLKYNQQPSVTRVQILTINLAIIISIISLDAGQGRSDAGYIGIFTLPKSGQVNFYGVKITS